MISGCRILPVHIDGDHAYRSLSITSRSIKRLVQLFYIGIGNNFAAGNAYRCPIVGIYTISFKADIHRLFYLY